MFSLEMCIEKLLEECFDRVIIFYHFYLSWEYFLLIVIIHTIIRKQKNENRDTGKIQVLYLVLVLHHHVNFLTSHRECCSFVLSSQAYLLSANTSKMQG